MQHMPALQAWQGKRPNDAQFPDSTSLYRWRESVLEKRVVEKCFREVLEKSVGDKLYRSVGEECCRGALEKSVGEESCREGLETSVVEKRGEKCCRQCWEDVLKTTVGKGCWIREL